MKKMLRSLVPLAVFLVLAFPLPVGAGASWLDSPTWADWNAARSIPAPPTVDGFGQALQDPGCLARDPATSEEHQVADAGWKVFGDSPIVFLSGASDIVIVLGTAGQDGMCRPWEYQAFFFKGGRFAGTLSPLPMEARFTGELYDVRVVNQLVLASFARCPEIEGPCRPLYPTFVQYFFDEDDRGPYLRPDYELRLSAPAGMGPQAWPAEAG